RCWRYVKEELREVSCLMEMCYLVNDGFDLHFDERKLFRVSYVLKTKNRLVNDAPLDKRKKLGTGRIMASTTSSQGKQALIPIVYNAYGQYVTESCRCETFSTYPRSYDLVHVEGLLSLETAKKHRCRCWMYSLR
ncbi:probable pectin methyltransferase QUA2, partial [Tanacetum coccineum]